MNLAALAKKAAALPELNFDWPGPEHFSDTRYEHVARYVWKKTGRN